MLTDLVFTVLDSAAQAAAVNLGLAAGAVAVAGLAVYATVQLRRHRREVRARAAVEAALRRARWQQILDAINGRDR